jgi:hypothetical protein
MRTRTISKDQVLQFAIPAAFFLFAVWLLSPFFKIGPEDYAHAQLNVYRLSLGLLILMSILGKLAFDVFFPQGIAQKVSNLKSVALIIYAFLILVFILYVLVQAAGLYLQSSDRLDQLLY